MSTSEARREIDGWLDKTVLAAGRCSGIFRTQLAHHLRFRLYHVHIIMDEVRHLEGREKSPSATKPAAPFNRSPLKGLWHKHHLQPRFMGKNLALHWNLPKKRSELEAHLEEAQASGSSGRLIHNLVIGGYTSRVKSQEATGEWIVYVPFDRRNYYLTLGGHGKDRAILRNVSACLEEFPELENVLPVNFGVRQLPQT